MDDNAEARRIVDALPRLDAGKYDRRRLHRALQEDIDALTEIWYDIKDLSVTYDAKLQQLKSLLETDLHGQKVIIFIYYKDTAATSPGLSERRNAAGVGIGNPHIRRIDSTVRPPDRARAMNTLPQWPPVS
jgi:hypothetical protein